MQAKKSIPSAPGGIRAMESPMTAISYTHVNPLVCHRKTGTENGWATRHNDAVMGPRAGHEEAIVLSFAGLHAITLAHRARFETPIGDDGFLGPRFTEMLGGLRAMLNGELGRLDAGVMDGAILKLAELAGVDEADL